LIFAIVEDAGFRKLLEDCALAENEGCLILKTEEELEEALLQETPKVLVIDMGVSLVDAPTWIEKVKLNPATRTIPIVVFGNSLRADLMQDARELGVDLALPKASFRQQLPEIIRRYQKK
jgi:CheY-like chemotaxis protein